ncbi:hypothetical protein NHL51_11915 [Leucobacter sp. gxy201]|uniref:hypothetical protein n=1 Tax=Leucobacter sp. gxy201 TaxID=2957200 RepID=UPI003DA11408
MSGMAPAGIDLSRLLSPAPAERDEQRAERPLRPVSAPTARRQKNPLTGALLAVGIVLVILATQLGLSIAVSQGAYEKRALELEQRDLSRVERLLAQNVDKLSSPQNLAENAAQLGMVQNARPAALRLSDGAILGSLETSASEAQANLVPNSTLADMPVVDAEGLLVPRQAAAATTEPAVRWKGKLPAPETH